jgi:hypothetical protein
MSIDYARHLWLEREIRSVANVSRQEVAEFLALAAPDPHQTGASGICPGRGESGLGGIEVKEDPRGQGVRIS